MNTITSPAVALATIKPPQSLLIKPVASIGDIVAAWRDYQDLKSKLLSEVDYQMIQGKNCIKKSGWRKIQTAFSISDELIREERKDYKTYFVYEVTVKVTAPNGRYAFGIGSCASNERKFAHLEHDCRGTAHTRSKNRAISDLVGGGDVSAEEMLATEEREVERPESNNNWLEETFLDKTNKPTREIETDEEPATEKQKNLLEILIYKKVDANEQSARLEEIQNFSKREASDAISELLQSRQY